jgi:hypothetical protein
MQAMLKELHNMEIALGKFQDIFSSIGHEVRRNAIYSYIYLLLPILEFLATSLNYILGSEKFFTSF